MAERHSLIASYFRMGLNNDEICAALLCSHNIDISLSTVKRCLSALQLFRRKNYSCDIELVIFLYNELQESGQMHGYKWMHLKCIQGGFTATQDTVRQLLYLLDPDGVSVRRRRRLRRRVYFAEGPNAVWHMDGYDKLKPYGITIHGCIDGFSRYIIWLYAYTTNSDPRVIASHYTCAVRQYGGCPSKLRADMGTENIVVEQLQIALTNNQHAFSYGKSTHNQRIEAWWGILRRENCQFWINIFEELKEEDFNGSFLDKSLVQFCFMQLIQVCIVCKMIC